MRHIHHENNEIKRSKATFLAEIKSLSLNFFKSSGAEQSKKERSKDNKKPRQNGLNSLRPKTIWERGMAAMVLALRDNQLTHREHAPAKGCNSF
tara:strand:- start:317 stop:598 length:282 start_codon:yes stop_codon:yes gene_type:complete